jgi:hypothetical protein
MTNPVLDTTRKKSVLLRNLMQVLHLSKGKAGMTQVLHVQRMKEILQYLEDQIKKDTQKLLRHLKVSLEERHLHG